MLEPSVNPTSTKSSFLPYLLGGLVVFISGGVMAWSISSAVFVKKQSPLVLNATQLSLATESSLDHPSSPSLALDDCSVVIDPATQNPRVNCSNQPLIEKQSGPQVAGEQISAPVPPSEQPKVLTPSTFEDWILTGISVLASIWK